MTLLEAADIARSHQWRGPVKCEPQEPNGGTMVVKVFAAFWVGDGVAASTAVFSQEALDKAIDAAALINAKLTNAENSIEDVLFDLHQIHWSGRHVKSE